MLEFFKFTGGCLDIHRFPTVHIYLEVYINNQSFVPKVILHSYFCIRERSYV